MNIQQLEQGIVKFIDTAILPKASGVEKIALQGGVMLGIFNPKEMLNKALSSKILQNSNIWTNAEKTEFDLSNLKKLAYMAVEQSPNGEYVFGGYPVDFIFYKANLFGGFVINKSTLDSLFAMIEGNSL